MSNLKSKFSSLLTQTRLFKSRETLRKLKFPMELSTKLDIFHYLNFNIPDLQIVKLSLNSGQQEKAFDQFFHYMKKRHAPTFTCSWWKRDEILRALKDQYPESVLNILKAADNILQHQFLLFSKHAIQAGSSICWNGNYEEGGDQDTPLWELGRTYSKAKLLADTRGDIQFVWELNRHQHFLDLGKAYWYTGEEEFVHEFMTEITEWIPQNPYLLSVNWIDSYEIALRGLFWIFGYTFFSSSDSIDEDFFCRFYLYLLFHGHTVCDLLQTTSKSLPAHHIVASAAFLYLVGTVFPEYLHSKTWSKFGWEILQWKTKLLSLEDILQTTLASLVNAIELYCIVLVVRKNNRYHIPQAVTEGLAKMFEQLSLFIKPNGTLCRFGEGHPVQLVKGMYGRSENFQYLFSMAAVLLKKGEFKVLGKTFREPLLWFLGKQGYQDFEKLDVKPLLQQSYLAPNSSYAVMRSGWEQDSGYCIIFNNATRSKQEPDVKHTDLLSLELFANGHELLIDSGPYSLQENDEWNQYFRSTYAHNGITVDRIKHINLSDRNVDSAFDHWVSTPIFDFLSGYHTGFRDLEEPITHRRSIFYVKPTYWIVSDLLTGEGQHFLDQYFHFPPLRLNVDFINKGVNIQIDEHHHFTLMPVGLDEMDVMIFTGGDTPDSGWMSDGYKHRVEAPFIKYGRRARVPACFHTLMYAYDSETILNASGRHLHVFSQGTPLLSDEVSAIEISVNQETHYFVLLYKEHQQIQFEDFTFSGKICFLRRSGDTLLELIFHNATLFTMKDLVLFQSDKPVDSLTLRVADEALHVLCSGNITFRTQLPHITQIFVNERRASLKQDQDMFLVSTSRI